MQQPDLFAPAAAPEPPATPAPVGPRANIWVGTCSWADPSLIKAGTFYPPRSSAESRLRFYATQFPIVEVDSSYFALPSAQNAGLWVERTPAAFRFNIKAFRLFTGHQTPPAAFPADLQPLLPALKGRSRNHYDADLPAELRDEMWRRYLEAIVPLKDSQKLIAVHFQFAPWVSATPEWTAHVEDCVQRMRGHLVAVEFRNRSWLADEARTARTLAWLRELGVVHTVVDEPQGVGNHIPSVWEVADPRLAIVRLHGRNAETWDAKGLASSAERFNYEYGDDELDELAGHTLSLAEQAFTVALLVNVNYGDQGIRAARRLLAKLGGAAPQKP